MNLTYDEFCGLLGSKDVEIYIRNKKIQELEAMVRSLTEKKEKEEEKDGGSSPSPAL